MPVRNGADDWMRHTLEQLGFSQYYLLPALSDQHAPGLALPDAPPMAGLRRRAVRHDRRMVLLALGLWMLLQLQNLLMASLAMP